MVVIGFPGTGRTPFESLYRTNRRSLRFPKGLKKVPAAQCSRS
jgi:hypothetical protein